MTGTFMDHIVHLDSNRLYRNGKTLFETDKNTNELLLFKQYYVYGELCNSQETEPVILSCFVYLNVIFCV